MEGPLDPLQNQIIDGVVVAEIGSQLPAPVNGIVECVGGSLNYLIDVPDSVLAGAAGLAAGADPYAAFNSAAANAQASLERFAGSLQAALTTLVARGECSAEASPAQFGNPLAGTPLAGVGAALSSLNTALQQVATEGPSLGGLSDVVAPALNTLAAELGGSLPAEVSSAPVVGGLFATVQQSVLDVAVLLVATADYDSPATAAASQTLIDNLLRGLLLGSLPVGEIDPAVEAQLVTGINTLSATLGSGVGQVVTPLFNEGLNGAANPLLNPTDGLLAGILAGGNPLEGLLAPLAGDSNNTAVDSYFGMLLSTFAGTLLQNLIVAAGGTATNSDSPLALLGALQSVLNTGGLDAILGGAVQQNDLLGVTLGTILDPLLGGGLLGGLL